LPLVVYEEKSLSTYRKYNDRLLASMANCGDLLAEQYIINKYKKLVKIKARTYFLVGADTEDIIQEGMIGLYKAVRSFNDLKLSSFRVFAEICINRQIFTAIKTASRQKHLPLNYYISLYQPVYRENSEQTLLDIIDDVNINDPMSLILSQERFKELKNNLEKVLSKLEKMVLECYLEGKTYREIANEVRKSGKSIDNALQRIKRKLEFIVKLN
jgi:RNA polymerase sporulation-specific sigma factor